MGQYCVEPGKGLNSDVLSPAAVLALLLSSGVRALGWGCLHCRTVLSSSRKTVSEVHQEIRIL
jgi:hypothetical protein